jgi:hypothetical protein
MQARQALDQSQSAKTWWCSKTGSALANTACRSAHKCARSVTTGRRTEIKTDGLWSRLTTLQLELAISLRYISLHHKTLWLPMPKTVNKLVWANPKTRGCFLQRHVRVISGHLPRPSPVWWPKRPDAGHTLFGMFATVLVIRMTVGRGDTVGRS